MAKKTAIIDLGTNGIRLAIFEKTSRFGFYIINEQKLKVRLSEGAYEKNGMLQEKQIELAKDALKYLTDIAKNYKCKKIICLGTSALRDAPNANDFIKLVKKEINLNIKNINGQMESYLGGFAALKLLANVKNATTIDIGGGSCELCLIEDGKIQDTLSLDIGTVRLKELYDIDKDYKSVSNVIQKQLDLIPKKYKNDNIIAIGGSLRAISNAIIDKNEYPHNKVHNFCYNFEDEKKFISSIIKSDNLSSLGIKKDRHDTIKYGTLMFLKLCKQLKAKKITTSGVGVREGIFLKDVLGKFSSFPQNTNPSLKSIQDRFETSVNKKTHIYAKKLLDVLSSLHRVGHYERELITAAKLSGMGLKTSFYSKHSHAAYLALNALNFGYTHEQKILIYTILSLHGKKPTSNTKFQSLLPSENTIVWLNYILALSVLLSKDLSNENLEFKLVDDKLIVEGKTHNQFLLQEYKKIHKPEPIELIFL